MPPPQTALARLLQEQRERAGYSRARLGQLVGISPGTIEGWELCRVSRPPFHEVLRLASFLRIPLEELQQAVAADVGETPNPDEHPGQPDRKRPGRKKTTGAVPLLEAAFRLFGWADEDEAADALAATPDQVRAWRRGSEKMGVAEYMTLTSIVNVALADAVSRGRSGSGEFAAAAQALGLGSDR